MERRVARAARPRRRIVWTVAATLGLVLGALTTANAAQAAGSTKIIIKSAKVAAGGDLTLKVWLSCPKGDNDYVYAEGDQDLYTNDATGNLYVSSTICTGKTQTLTLTVIHGRGISAMDYKNDQEADDPNAFSPGVVTALVSVGGQSDFTTQQRTFDLADDTRIAIGSSSIDVNGDIAASLAVECPAGDSNYIYAEADQDSYPNDAAGNVYVASFACDGTDQQLTVTIAHGRGITAMDYGNDVEADDLGAFAPGLTSVLVTMGGQSNFVSQQRTVTLH
jgi:hypothetical protein